MTKVEKPEWLKKKERDDGEIQLMSLNGRDMIEVPKSRGATYGPNESLVDQVGDGLIDVNHIMRRFEKIPTIEQLQAAGYDAGGGLVGDFIDAPDFEEALQIANRGKAAFALLPAHLRERFLGNPANFLRFVNDPANTDEMIQMGLMTKKVTPEPEVTLKDVRDAITATAKPKKPAGKGGEDEGG